MRHTVQHVWRDVLGDLDTLRIVVLHASTWWTWAPYRRH
jgi:hypothetical protein